MEEDYVFSLLRVVVVGIILYMYVHSHVPMYTGVRVPNRAAFIHGLESRHPLDHPLSPHTTTATPLTMCLYPNWILNNKESR